MENKYSSTTQALLAALQENNLFTDTQKAKVFGRILDKIPEEDTKQILDLFKKS